MTANLTPRQALDQLIEGNKRFVQDPHHPRVSAERRAALTSGQEPFAAVLGCADSRVPMELVFDQGLGDLFAIRTAGEVVDTGVLASVEFAIDGLGCPLLVVLGHESCGAVAATVATIGGTVPGGFQRVLAEKIAPSIMAAQAGGATTTDEYEAAHVAATVKFLVETSPVVASAISEGRLAVVGMRYRLSDGLVEPVVSRGLPE